jgi:replicative DNA helicase
VVRPRPVTRDIRGSGMLKNDADNVMFVYREQDPSSGDPLPSSSFYLAKARSGTLGRSDTMFDSKHLRFDEVQV